MVGVSMSLNDIKHLLLRQSLQRYDILRNAHSEMMHEISKVVNNTKHLERLNEIYRSEYKEDLLDFQVAVNARFAARLHELGTIEQSHRQEVDAMYACATNALADELSHARSNQMILNSILPDGRDLVARRLEASAEKAAQQIERFQEAANQSLVRQNASSSGFKRPRSSSADPVGDQDSESEDRESEDADGDVKDADLACDGDGDSASTPSK